MKREYWRYFAVTFPYLARRSAVPAVRAVAGVALVSQRLAIMVAMVVAFDPGRGWWRIRPGLRRAPRRAAP